MWEVLIVEDNQKDCQRIVDGLKEKAQCTTTADGEKALEIYSKRQKENKPFDFILLDVDMPKQNGFQVLKTIRSLEEDSPHETSIIMVTTYKDSLLEHYNMGWDDFLTKPIDTSVLVNRMESIAEKNKK